MTRQLAIEAWQTCQGLIYDPKMLAITNPDQLKVGKILFRMDAFEPTIKYKQSSFCFGTITEIINSGYSPKINSYRIEYFPALGHKSRPGRVDLEFNGRFFENTFNLSDTINNFIPIENFHLLCLSFKTLVPGVGKFLPKAPENNQQVRLSYEATEKEFNKTLKPEIERERVKLILLSDPIIKQKVAEIAAQRRTTNNQAAMMFMQSVFDQDSDQLKSAFDIVALIKGIKSE